MMLKYTHHILPYELEPRTVIYGMKYSRTPLIRTLVFRNADYRDRLGCSCKFVQNSRKLIALKLPVIRSNTEQRYGF